jgi:Domain of unknown function (DUF1905)
MDDDKLRFESDVWRYPGNSAWHFITVPSDVSEEIRARTDGNRRGFGSVRVAVVIGSSAWSTSVFPDKSTGCFLLPVKKPVRLAEQLDDGDTASVTLELIEV